MKIAVRRKKWLAAGVVAVSLATGAFWLFARDYGPYMCGTCSLGKPVPDVATYAALEAVAPIFGLRWTESGNTYIICNGAACGYYRVTETGDFHNDKNVPQEFVDPPQSGGGGGNEGGGSGAIGNPFPGGGGGGGGGGTVIVAPVEKVQW